MKTRGRRGKTLKTRKSQDLEALNFRTFQKVTVFTVFHVLQRAFSRACSACTVFAYASLHWAPGGARTRAGAGSLRPASADGTWHERGTQRRRPHARHTGAREGRLARARRERRMEHGSSDACDVPCTREKARGHTHARHESAHTTCPCVQGLGPYFPPGGRLSAQPTWPAHAGRGSSARDTKMAGHGGMLALHLPRAQSRGMS